LIRKALEPDVVVTVIVSVAGVDPLTEVELGETVQVESEGAPVQASETVPLKPRFPPTEIE